MNREDEFTGAPLYTNVSKTGKLIIAVPFILAIVVISAVYVENTGIFTHLFSNMLWGSLKYGLFGLTLAYVMGKVLKGKQKDRG